MCIRDRTGKNYVDIKTSAQCGSCKSAIEKAVNNVDGVKSAELDLETKIAVSYTHLRAHETVLDLVCRLLLEKKKNQQKKLLLLQLLQPITQT